MKKLISSTLFTILLVVFLGVSHAYFFVPDLEHQGESVAYRGGGSLVDYNKLNKTSCIAKSLLESEVTTIENTLEAVTSSLNAGADVIHLNVHRTLDDQLVVFHDWTLDCATNSGGPVNQALYQDLESVDAGFSYTFDGGRTFPFRGQGFKISRLDEFYSQFSEQKFWVNLKDNDEHSFDLFYSYLSSNPSIYSRTTMIITSSKGVSWFRRMDSSIRVISVGSVKDCGIDYLLVGWAGIVPESCNNTTLFIPPSKAKYFWGYPRRLASRLQEQGTDVYLWSKHHPIDPTLADVVVDGVGVVTSDVIFIKKAQANRRASKRN